MRTGIETDLSGRVMLITGASSGIGAAVARQAAASGAKIVLTARRTGLLDQLAEEINAAGGHAAAVAMDVASEVSTIAAFDAAEAAFGPVNTVIANAGIGYRGRATDISMDEYDRLMAINTRGVFLTAREGARRMIAAGSADHHRGRIVIVSSVAATAVESSMSVYSASKAAVLHMGRCLAREWIRLGINVNMVLPGYIHTELTDELFASAAGEKLISGLPRRRLMQLEDVVPTLLFLASDAARATTGAAFTIDDGQTL